MADIGIVIILSAFVLVGSLGTSIHALSTVNDLRNTGVGITGPAGAPGTAANTGATGPAGPQGSPGTAANTGAAGPAGPAGVTGPQGSAGVAGPTGPQGTPGTAVNTGATGPAGAQGPTGVQGAAGITGPQGTPGTAVNTGATGPAGPTGQGLGGTGSLLLQPFLYHPLASQNGLGLPTASTSAPGSIVTSVSIVAGSCDSAGKFNATINYNNLPANPATGVNTLTFTVTFNTPYSTSPRAIVLGQTCAYNYASVAPNPYPYVQALNLQLWDASHFVVILNIIQTSSTGGTLNQDLFSWIVM